ncbi:MAG: DNA polymerase III subunit alpha, partial [Vicinamibacteria bacterium]
MSFVHLHVHSHYSLLDGAVHIKKLVKAAKEYGMPALALTDHGNLFGAVKFYQACKAEGVKPIIGMEAYIAPGSRHEKKRTPGGAFFHQLLLARNEEGYHNLMKLASLAYLEGFYYRPRIDKEILREYAGGLIGTSACLSSQINRAALSGDEAELRAEIESYRSIFEPGAFFLELQRNGIQEQERILEKIPPLAKEYGLPLIATNDVHYLRREDARAQEVHLCINTGQTMDDSDRLRFDCDQFYFRSEAEMERVLGDFKEALENTLQVAEMCNVELDFESTHLPVFVIQDEDAKDMDPTRYFRKLCTDGCRERYPDYDDRKDVQERLEYEMQVIEKMGYPSYFLITWDFIRYARHNNIPVGPGRGSAAGSLVAYALGITNIDPLKYDLLFERFLNADRISMPDIDIDFCMEGREKVIEYVKKKYGKDRVCQIITFGTMAARAVIRDVGRALNVPLSEVDAIAKKIPSGPGVKLGASIEADPSLKEIRRRDPKLRELFDISLRLEGLNRHCSTHAAGVVIGDAPLIDTLPLYRNGEDITTQFVMEDLDAVGMLKMDLLGLRTLTVIDKALTLARKTRGVDLAIDAIPLDDAATYELLCRGDTVAVFQLESMGMRDLLRRLKPDRFEDIIAVLALYRPGPLEGGMVDTYIERKHGREPMVFEHPILEPLLKETNGVILYQEQVMRIANHMGGFTLNEADTLRKAMGKKKKEIMEKYKTRFVDGAHAKGIGRDIAKRIFDLIEYFAGYGFNKSHSTAYA